MIKTGIIEGAGFSGGELIRLLLNHPDVHLIFITGRGNSGQYIHEVHRGLYGETELRFAEEPQLDKIDLLFLCTDAEEISIAKSHDVYSLIYRIQEEVHRFSLAGMDAARRRGIKSSSLTAIDGIGEKKAAGELSPASHPQCRPSELEAEAVSRLLKMAQLADIPVVIVHLSSAAGLREVEAARARGQKVVLLMSVTSKAVGSSLLPVPMELMMGVPAA